jgi:hypothetical protein
MSRCENNTMEETSMPMHINAPKSMCGMLSTLTKYCDRRNTEARNNIVATGILIISNFVMSIVNKILDSSVSWFLLSQEVHILSDFYR